MFPRGVWCLRYVPVRYLKEKQVLATDLFYDNRRVVIRRGIALTPNMIKRIRQLGFQGAYIEDALSEGLEVAPPVSDELRSSTQKAIQSLFVTLGHNHQASATSALKGLRQLVDETIDQIMKNRHVMANMIDLRSFDDYTYGHSVNVSLLSSIIGASMEMNRSQLVDLALGAMLHDIGKVFIDKQLLNKREKLEPCEFEEIKQHSRYGYDYLLTNDTIPENSKIVALTHHEKYDGSGYPAGLARLDIPLFGRIVCIADVYDALTSDRPYRKALLPSDALEYIMSGYGNMFDADVIDSFLRRIAIYPVGTCVRLSTGETAIVVENFPSMGRQPKVRVIEDGKPTDREIDLAHDRNALCVTIVETVNL